MSCWYSPHTSVDVYRYYISFVDDFTRFVWIYPLMLKSEVATTILNFYHRAWTNSKHQRQYLQKDGGGEYHPLVSHLHSLGIVFPHPCPYTHQQHRRAERKHRSIVDMGLTLLAKASMDFKFWWDAFLSATYLLNRLSTPLLKNKSPFEAL